MTMSNDSSQFVRPTPTENRRSSLSPFGSALGSSYFFSNPVIVDDDIEIKMEPLEELLDIGGMIHSGETNHPSQQQQPHQQLPPEDNLLDNVNFEDLLMTDDMDSSTTTTCLDPQHSSPAAMATVHPDEVLGLMRSESYPAHVSQSSTSVNVPLKLESVSFGGLATSSFPPQGIGWKDPVQNQSVPNHPLFQDTGPYQTNLGGRSTFGKETVTNNQHHNSRFFFLRNEGASESAANHRLDTSVPYNNHQNNSNNNNNCEPQYIQLESPSNTTTTTSALHDLLVNSPTLSHSPHLHHQTQLSPANSNTSPASPLIGISPQDVPVGQSVPGPPSFLGVASPNLSSRLSSSAPVNNFSLDQIWQRREPRPHLLSTGSLVAEEGGGSTSSLSTGGGILSPIPHDLSIDEEIDSEEESDVEHYDSESDNDSIMSEDLSSLGSQSGKKERHFWQYNVQAKGPKGQRVSIMQNETDPHQLDKIMDPVFSPLCSNKDIKHSGKARRGDGNDLTPSPRKLVYIGIELSKLNKKINEMTPVSELPSTVRSKSRKEKNKLASRACRLKKKAQHEANKIKLYGLEQEHKAMMGLINKAKEELVKKIELAATQKDHSQRQPSPPTETFLGADSSPGSLRQGGPDVHDQMQQLLTGHIEKAAKVRTKQRIAGFTTEFVNKVIETCKNGNTTGGLDELAHTFVKTTTLANENGTLNYNNELYT